jgi:hypothetical protein
MRYEKEDIYAHVAGPLYKDKYDEAIEYLQLMPKEIWDAWTTYSRLPQHSAHCLFAPCGQDNRFGCLTQIRADCGYIAATPELTKAILADKRIPSFGPAIICKDLPIFAEWQRRIDKELNRV